MLVIPRGVEGAEGDPLNHQQVAGVVTDTAELFDRETGGEQASRATVLLRKRQAEELQLLQ